MKRPFLFLLTCSFLFACSSDDDFDFSPESSLGSAYFPLKLGQEKIFRVDSVIYDDFSGSVDTNTFFRKEVLVDTFKSGSGEQVFIKRISFRASDSLPWILQKDLSLKKASRGVERQEDNILRLILTFPIAENISWDANVLNTLEETNYRYEMLFQPFDLNGVQFDSTVAVLQRDEENLIERFFTQEIYAPGRGLIYRKDVELDLELSGEIRKGFETSIRLLEFTP